LQIQDGGRRHVGVAIVADSYVEYGLTILGCIRPVKGIITNGYGQTAIIK